MNPAVSPDGKKIAYEGKDIYNAYQGTEIFVLEIDASGAPVGDPVAVTNTPRSNAKAPAWPLDGRNLAYTVVEWDESQTVARSNIYTVPSTGGASRRVTSGDDPNLPAPVGYGFDSVTGAHEPAFSPDGQKIVYRRDAQYRNHQSGGGYLRDLYLVDASPSTAGVGTPIIDTSDHCDWNCADKEAYAEPDWGPAYGTTPPPPPADTTAPTVSLTAPAEGATVSGSSVNLSADASDDSAVTRVDFYVGSTKVGSDSTAGGTSGKEYSYIWDSTTVSDSTKTITACAYDAANNEKISSSRTITVKNATTPPTDTTKPTVSLTAPADNATVSGASVALKAEASDDTGVTEARFYVWKDGAWSLVGTDSTAGGTSGKEYSYTWDSTSVPDGQTWVYADARDAAGNGNYTEARPITVDNSSDTGGTPRRRPSLAASRSPTRRGCAGAPTCR